MAYPKKPERKPGETDSDFTARMEAWAVRLEAAKEKAREYYVENAERIRERQREYYVENAERIREYYVENAERIRERWREYGRKYRAENAEQLRERKREYRAENAERIREYYVENAERIRKRQREYYAEKFGLSRAEYLKTIRHACGIKASLGEAAVCGYLESAGIKFEREKTFDWLRNSETGCRFRCDFYLPDLGTVIEYNGPQHYGYRGRDFTPDALARRMVMDLEKAEKIAARGLRLVAIPGDEIRTAGQIRQYLARELASDGRADSK